MKFTSDIVIGLEIHVELNTNTKLFCSCATKGNEEPNTRTCPICLGHPGSKPVLNKKAVDYAIKLGLALNCDIDNELIFSRKSYFYPDLAKNFQTTQYERPLCNGGFIELSTGKKVNLTRIHIEEDPAALVHPNSINDSSYVLVDYNRSGNPLCEIVTEPDMTTPEEAREFMKKLITILEYLEIFDGENGIIKADANISIKESGYVRSEVKNITGFKEIERALNYEVQRQRKAVSDGEALVMDTRGWNAEKGISSRLRTKESEEDYGYIIDPDLVPIDVTPEWIESIRKDIPELADEKMKKFLSEHKIADDMAEIISKDKDLAKHYELLVGKVNDAELVSKFVRRDFPKILNYHKLDAANVSEETNAKYAAVLNSLKAGDINQQAAFKISSEVTINESADVEVLINDNKQVSDDSAIEAIVQEVITEQAENVEKYKNGEEKILNFLVGQVMRKSKGAANPGKAKEVLLKLL